MDCCSLEGRTLKDPKVVKYLSEFVLVKMPPMKNAGDREFAEGFGVTEYPALLFLDPGAKRKIGSVGNVSPEEVAAALRKALGKN